MFTIITIVIIITIILHLTMVVVIITSTIITFLNFSGALNPGSSRLNRDPVATLGGGCQSSNYGGIDNLPLDKNC